MADLQTIIARMMGQEQEQNQQPRRGLFGATFDPQTSARIRGDFGGGAGAQLGRDFRAGFDSAAANVRQALSHDVLGALSNSGIPGWEGLQRAQATANAVGMDAPGAIPTTNGVALGSVIDQPKPLGPQTPPPRPMQSNAGMRAQEPIFPGNQAQIDNQAFAEARARARAGIAEEGYPYMSSPSWVQSRTEMDRALDADRAARAEQARREGVSFDQFWHFGGRQDPSQRDPNDPAFRFTRPTRR